MAALCQGTRGFAGVFHVLRPTRNHFGHVRYEDGTDDHIVRLVNGRTSRLFVHFLFNLRSLLHRRFRRVRQVVRTAIRG